MTGWRRPKRQKDKTKKARADGKDDPVLAEHTAPTPGLDDLCFAGGQGFMEALELFTSHTAAQQKHKQHDCIEVMRRCLKAREYPEFEPPEVPNHTGLAFEEYHA